MTSNGGITAVGAGALAGLNAFLAESIALMMPWVITMSGVIVVDMLFGIRRSLLMGEEVRFSYAIRRTMLKAMTYIPFVGMVSMVETAMHSGNRVAMWCSVGVIFTEGCSIASNLLKPMGYKFNVLQLLFLLARRKGVEGLENVVTKEEQNDETNKA